MSQGHFGVVGVNPALLAEDSNYIEDLSDESSEEENGLHLLM